MANKWVEHVRKWSAEHGVSYMCATSMPACKEDYKKSKPPKNTQKANREQMGMEDKDVALPKKAKQGITADTLKDKISQIKEAKKMGVEDIKSAMLRRAQGIVQPLQSADTAVVKPKGRPKKYDTAEEARRMKSVKTVEARNRRRAEKAKAKEPVVEAPKVQSSKPYTPYPQEKIEAYRRQKAENDREEAYEKAKKLKPMDEKLRLARDEYDHYERNHIDAGDAGYSYATKDKMRAREKASLAKAWNLPKDWYGSGYHGMQEVTDDELFRTMALGGAHADADQVDNYSMIINHLVEHISDPSEPVDPRDYDQAIHFIREMRRAKGGAELYSREYYGGMMPAGAPPPPPPRSDAGRRVFYTPGLLEIMEQFLRPAGAVPEDIRQAIIDGRNVPRLHGGDLGDDLRKGLHEAGKPFSILGINPGSTGFDLGQNVIAPAMMKTKWGNPKTGIFSKSFWTPKKHHR
jgi:hypothetical protein